VVDNLWLADFIVTCKLVLAVGFLPITCAWCYSLPALVTNRRLFRILYYQTAVVDLGLGGRGNAENSDHLMTSSQPADHDKTFWSVPD